MRALGPATVLATGRSDGLGWFEFLQISSASVSPDQLFALILGQYEPGSELMGPLEEIERFAADSDGWLPWLNEGHEFA